MDEILYLEPDEEITSVIDKLKKSNSDSIGLVIPRNSGLIHSIVNLKLLKKEAEKRGKEIALITADKVGKNIASQVGITVFEDIHAKRPAASHMPELPKGDEVIEVDMSQNQEESSDEIPAIKHYSGKSSDDKESEPDSVLTSPSVKSFESHRITTKAEAEPKPFSAHTEPKASSPNNHRSKKGLVVFVSLFLLIIFGTVFGLPQTSIMVTVAAEPFEKEIKVTVDSSVKENNNSEQVVAGKLLEVKNDDAKRVVATGKKDVGGKTKGTVVITNAWDSNPIKFTAGTTFTSTDGKTFTLVSDVTVPGATVALKEGQLVTNPGSVAATITATEPGEAYNIKATKFTISGLSSEKQAKIYGESTKDFTGGFTKQVNVMTQSDIDTAKDELVKELNKQATDELRKQAKDLKVIDEAVTDELVSVETNPKDVDTETDYFDITVKAKHQVMVFDDKVVNTIVNETLKKDVPADKELLLGEGDEFTISVDDTDYSNNHLILLSKVKTKIGTRVNASEAKKGLNGKNESAVVKKLKDLPNVKDVTIRKFPSWWWQDTSFLPWNTRLQVIYE